VAGTVFKFKVNNHSGAVLILGLAVVSLALISFWPGKFGTSAKPGSTSCQNISGSEKQQCWDETMSQTIKSAGLEAAFDLLGDLYTADPEYVAKGCHWNAHQIGEAAYHLFTNGQDLAISPKSAYCGYGFYHGFMGLLLRNDSDLSKARHFCDKVGRTLSEKAPISRLNCYHGIGHGLIEDPPDPKTWGKPQAMLDPALKICEQVSDREEEIKDCSNGSFNAVVLFMENSQYGLSLNKADPFWLCRDQRPIHKYNCYYETSQKLDYLGNFDIPTIGKIITGIKDQAMAEVAAHTALASLLQHDIQGEDFTKYVTGCHSFSGQLRLECIRGASGGFMAHGNPGEEYVKAIKFCQLNGLADDERDVCYSNIIRTFKGSYTKDKVQSVCQGIDERYRNYCRYD